MTVSKTKASATRRPTFDPLLVLMALGFALAVAAMVYPAFRANAFTAPGLNMPERGLAYNALADRRSGAAMRQFLEEVLA